jgi:hypothetical protein
VSRPLRPRILVALALVVSFALGAVLPGAFAGTEVAPTAIRNALAQTTRVQGAPGRTMVLSRVEVEPGAKLALHRHLGTQVAHVETGTLTYTVREGAVVVRKGESDAHPTKVRSIGAGQTGAIRAGQWIVEQPSDIHEAANRGSVPVVIYIATLLKNGAAPATPVTLP